MNATKNRPVQSINEQNGFYPNLSKTSNEVLIPIFNHDVTNEVVVDARQLHKKLKIQTKFTTWMERRIQEYEFEEGIEFFPILGKTSKNSKGGRPSIEYQLTTSMAQELCILDNSPVGKALRLYLLQCLKNSQNKHAILNDLSYLMVSGRKLYHYRTLQRLLGFSTKSSISNVRRCYSSQLFFQGREAYVTEDYALLMILRAETRTVAQKTLVAPEVVSNQLNLFQL